MGMMMDSMASPGFDNETQVVETYEDNESSVTNKHG